MTNMNALDREIGIPYLLCRDGRRCNTINGDGCGKSITQLIEESNFRFEMLDKIRKLPVIVIDCIDNSGEHRIDIYNEELMKQYQILCNSCNKIKNPHRVRTTQTTGKSPTREKLDSLNFNPTYHRNLHNFLLDNQHICLKEMKMAGKKLSGGANQVTTDRYFEDELRTNANTTGRYQSFPYLCDSDHCNGTHVCLIGLKPTKLLDQERITLIKQWEYDYDKHRDTWKTNSVTLLKPFIEQEEFIETHCILLKHYFY